MRLLFQAYCPLFLNVLKNIDVVHVNCAVQEVKYNSICSSQNSLIMPARKKEENGAYQILEILCEVVQSAFFAIIVVHYVSSNSCSIFFFI